MHWPLLQTWLSSFHPWSFSPLKVAILIPVIKSIPTEYWSDSDQVIFLHVVYGNYLTNKWAECCSLLILQLKPNKCSSIAQSTKKYGNQSCSQSARKLFRSVLWWILWALSSCSATLYALPLSWLNIKASDPGNGNFSFPQCSFIGTIYFLVPVIWRFLFLDSTYLVK